MLGQEEYDAQIHLYMGLFVFKMDHCIAMFITKTIQLCIQKVIDFDYLKFEMLNGKNKKADTY